MNQRILLIVAAVGAALAIGLGARLAFLDRPQQNVAGVGEVLVGGPFELIDQNGAVRREADFRGDYMLVYFGYSFCPDICPTSLWAMTVALDSLPTETAARIQPVFVTVDPARDTVEALARYATNFHPRLVALTGSEQQVAEAAKAYRIYYARQGDGEDYLVDHTSLIYLIDPSGKYVTHFNHLASSEEIAARLEDLPF